MEKLNVYQTPADLANLFANQLMSRIAQKAEGEFHLAISGGKTPDLLFAILAEKYTSPDLWHKVHFWWVDERMVPPDHPESNYRVANQLLLSQISIAEENIHRIKGENNPEEEALSYAVQIQKNLPSGNGWPVFDLILLGMGDDGHTASIFPDQMELLESDQICAVATHPVSGQKRVTLTGKAINNAVKICFLVTGAGKAERLKEMRNYPDLARSLPAFHILNAEWFVDQAAAYLHR
ncbi:MAG: 6-phosphogluconolactonase [Prolixibacteraceae bacterium]|nr:6-phosphogluconolactonase [Prolixibacteraceae bacterium]